MPAWLPSLFSIPIETQLGTRASAKGSVPSNCAQRSGRRGGCLHATLKGRASHPKVKEKRRQGFGAEWHRTPAHVKSARSNSSWGGINSVQHPLAQSFILTCVPSLCLSWHQSIVALAHERSGEAHSLLPPVKHLHWLLLYGFHSCCSFHVADMSFWCALSPHLLSESRPFLWDLAQMHVYMKPSLVLPMTVISVLLSSQCPRRLHRGTAVLGVWTCLTWALFCLIPSSLCLWQSLLGVPISIFPFSVAIETLANF